MQLELSSQNFRPEQLEKYQKVKDMVREGKTLKDSLKKFSLHGATYHKMRKSDPEGLNLRPPRGSEKLSKKAKPTFMDLPLHASTEQTSSDENAYIIVVKSSKLKDILGSLK